MDKTQKFDYMQSIEQYLEEGMVYEMFEDLLKQVIVERPDKPLEFLLKKIKSAQSR
jgi:adenylate kinase